MLMNKKRRSKKAKLEISSKPKDDCITVNGEVIECLPGTEFRVKLETGQEIIAHVAGKLRKFRIRVLLGDKVTLELSPYRERLEL